MTEDVFSKIKQPVFNAYYNQDGTVSVPAIKKMHEQLGGKRNKLVAFPKSGTHMIVSELHSKDIESIKEASFRFAEEVVGMREKIVAIQ